MLADIGRACCSVPLDLGYLPIDARKKGTPLALGKRRC